MILSPLTLSNKLRSGGGQYGKMGLDYFKAVSEQEYTLDPGYKHAEMTYELKLVLWLCLKHSSGFIILWTLNWPLNLRSRA